MRPKTPFEEKFPKFLIADNTDVGRSFVVHLHHPRFLAEVKGGYRDRVKLVPEFIDTPEDVTSTQMAALLRQASDYFMREMDKG